MTATVTPIRAGTTLRSAGHGAGLDGGPCPERQDDPQVQGARWRMCIRCSRVTPRVDRDWAPWCGGQISTRTVPTTVPLRNERTVGVCRCGEPARMFTYGLACRGCRIGGAA